MIRIICFILFCLSAGLASAQCGSVIQPEAYRQAKKTFKPWLDFAKANRSVSNQANDLFRVPIRVTIFKSGSNQPCTVDQFMEALEECNNVFLQEDIEFYICQDIRIIDNATYYNLDLATEEAGLASAYDQGKRAMNLFITNDLDDGSTGLNGKAAFPWRSHTRAYLRASVITDPNNKYKTMAHEFGHFMGLLHTHSTANGTEDVTRLTGNSCYNCDDAGDELCDTAADPNVDGNYNSSCIYDGGLSSPCSSISYAPDVRNLMSYGRDCRFRFSAGQFSRMRDMFDFYYDNDSPNGKDMTCDCAPVNITVGYDLKASHIYAAPTVIMSKNIESNANVVFVAQKILLKVGFNATGTGVYSAEAGCNYPFLSKPNDAFSAIISESSEANAKESEAELAEKEDFATQVFPNPAREELTIRFYVDDHSQAVDLSVWNLQGKMIHRALSNQNFESGWQEHRWMLKDGTTKIAAGTYLLRIIKGETLETRKIVIQP